MRKLTRRELLKASLGTMGALALANLPNWNKPALRVGVLPAHAQSSIDINDLRAVLTWDKGIPIPDGNGDKAARVDLDLFVWEPDGTLVYYGHKNGPTATLDFDNLYGFGPEITYVPQGMAAAGRYWIGVATLYVEDVGDYPVTGTLKVTSFQNQPGQQFYTRSFVLPLPQDKSAEPSVQIPIAYVDFPSGVITPWNYTKDVTWPTGGKK